MTEDLSPNPGLLPNGLRDLLPPDAEVEANSVHALMEVFSLHGYQRVEAPLVEFEETLLAGSGAAVADQTFRVMDPDSHRMMGIRADITPQIARIATTRLEGAPRPLRLSYAGTCLRLRGNSLSPDRQLVQAGIEMIGVDSPDSDAEMVLVGSEALAALGLERVSFDLTLPSLATALVDAAGLPPDRRAALVRALDRKDAAAVTERAGPLAGTLTDLLLAAGPADRAMAALAAADLPVEARAHAERLAASLAAIRARAPHIRLTVDPVEFRGFRYHSGVCVTVYAPGRHEELGRGGRYICGESEPATGLTLYPDALHRAVGARGSRPRVFIAREADPAHTHGPALRRRGFATVSALGKVDDILAEARRMLCTHYLLDGTAVPIQAE